MLSPMPPIYVYLDIGFIQPEKRGKVGKFPKINWILGIGKHRVEIHFHFFSGWKSYIAFTHNGIVLTEIYFIAFVATVLYMCWPLIRARVFWSCLLLFSVLQKHKKKRGNRRNNYIGYTQKNGTVSKVNKKCISHLTRARHTRSAVPTVSHALPAVRFSCLLRGQFLRWRRNRKTLSVCSVFMVRLF